MKFSVGDTVEVLYADDDPAINDDSIFGEHFEVIKIEDKHEFPVIINVYGTFMNFKESELKLVKGEKHGI